MSKFDLIKEMDNFVYNSVRDRLEYKDNASEMTERQWEKAMEIRDGLREDGIDV